MIQKVHVNNNLSVSLNQNKIYIFFDKCQNIKFESKHMEEKAHQEKREFSSILSHYRTLGAKNLLLAQKALNTHQ